MRLGRTTPSPGKRRSLNFSELSLSLSLSRSYFIFFRYSMTLGSMSLNPGVRCGYLRLPGSIMRRKSSLLYESFPEEGLTNFTLIAMPSMDCLPNSDSCSSDISTNGILRVERLELDDCSLGGSSLSRSSSIGPS